MLPPLISLLLYGVWNAESACGGAAETQNNECLPKALEENYSCVCVCVWEEREVAVLTVYSCTHTHTYETSQKHGSPHTWMMSDSPASLLFLPSLWVFPDSVGRSWVFLEADAGPLHRHCSNRCSLMLAVAGGRLQKCYYSVVVTHLVPAVETRRFAQTLSLSSSRLKQEVKHRIGIECQRMRKSLQLRGTTLLSSYGFCDCISLTTQPSPFFFFLYSVITIFFVLFLFFPFQLLCHSNTHWAEALWVKWGSPSCQTGRSGG